MASTLGGDDPSYDLSPQEKDKEEKRLREQARRAGRDGKKHRNRLINRANEISRRKSKKAHQ
jgi:hypothetical protein